MTKLIRRSRTNPNPPGNKIAQGKEENAISLITSPPGLDKKRVKDRLQLSSSDRRANANQPMIEFIPENEPTTHHTGYYDELNERFGDTNELAAFSDRGAAIVESKFEVTDSQGRNRMVVRRTEDNESYCY